MNTAVMTRTNNIPLNVTYNVAIGVDAMEKKEKNTLIEVQNKAEFVKLLKLGIYRSLCEKGVISSASFRQLADMQWRNEKCR